MTGRELNRRALLRAAGAAPVVPTLARVGGASRTGGGSGAPSTRSVSSATGGERIWSFETGDSVESEPTVVGGTVYVGANDKHVYALDAETGEHMWHKEFGSELCAPPSVMNVNLLASTAAEGYPSSRRTSRTRSGPSSSSTTAATGSGTRSRQGSPATIRRRISVPE